jgi:hypothetical protein
MGRKDTAEYCRETLPDVAVTAWRNGLLQSWLSRTPVQSYN